MAPYSQACQIDFNFYIPCFTKFHDFGYLCAMMTLKPSEYLTIQGSLDDLSVTELEDLIKSSNGSYLYKLLLARKMSQPYNAEWGLMNSDWVYRTFGFSDDTKIPQFEMLLEDQYAHVKEYDHNPEYQDVSYTGEGNTVVKSEGQPLAADATGQKDFPDAGDESSPFFSEQETDLPLPQEDVSDENDISKSQSAVSKNKKNTPMSVKKKGKKKKGKKSKFKLREFSGISTYTQWLLSFHRDDIEKKIEREKKAEKKRKLAELARKSITKSHDVVSEPLADLLVQQGHFDDAKKMYEQLMHRNPEKSRYFAAKLEDLLKNIENNSL